MQHKPMPCGLHLEGLGRVVNMFQDMWFRHTVTLEKDKSTTSWWKGMLGILRRKQIMQLKTLPGGLHLEGLESMVIMFKDMWFRHTVTMERENSTNVWWKGMLGILRCHQIMQHTYLPTCPTSMCPEK